MEWHPACHVPVWAARLKVWKSIEANGIMSFGLLFLQVESLNTKAARARQSLDAAKQDVAAAGSAVQQAEQQLSRAAAAVDQAGRGQAGVLSGRQAAEKAVADKKQALAAAEAKVRAVHRPHMSILTNLS